MMSNELHLSVSAMEGYCYFFRWLKFFSEKYPSLKEQANEKVKNFIDSEDHRVKAVVPDLGEFLQLMSLDLEYHWKDIASAYLKECYDRNVLWVVKQCPHLLDVSDKSEGDENRLQETLEVTIISKRILLFHVYFLENITRPHNGFNLVEELDSNLGKPTKGMRELWQEEVREILEVFSWEEYFSRLGLPMPDKNELLLWLKKSVTNSERKGYHDLLTENRDRRSRYERESPFWNARDRKRGGSRSDRPRESGKREIVVKRREK